MPRTTIKASGILREGKPTTRPFILEDFIGNGTQLPYNVNLTFPGVFNVMAETTLSASPTYVLDTTRINVPGTLYLKTTNSGTINAPTFTGMTALAGSAAWTNTTTTTHFIEFIYDGTKVRYRITVGA